MSENIPWQPPPEGVDTEPKPLIVPQEMYDHLMSLPPGTDITDYFHEHFTFEPGWENMTVTTEEPRWDTTN